MNAALRRLRCGSQNRLDSLLMFRAAERKYPATKISTMSARISVGAVGLGQTEAESGAGGGFVVEPDFAAMGANQLGGDGKTEAGSSRPDAALEGFEEIVAGAGGNTR